ncbi:MAG: hypothetical protein ACLSD3_12910 [Acutalibacteraceae bacterium]
MDAFIATTAVTNAGLSARAARLYAFMQENRNFRTDIFMWRKAKTCAALGISEATYARAIRELREKELVRETVRFSEITKRQLVSYYYVCHTGHAFSVESEAVRSLSHSTFSVYMEIARSCGKESWAISRRSLAKKLKLSMRTITRAVRELAAKDLISMKSENRLHICGNKGQTFNRFRLRFSQERCARRMRFMACFLHVLRALSRAAGSRASFPATPLDKFDTPLYYIPKVNSKEEKTKLSPIAKLKEIAGRIKNKILQWRYSRKAVLPD